MGWIVESDDWGAGASILARDTLARIVAALESSPVIVEHRFYRGSSAPERLVFDDLQDFQEYLGRTWNRGDAFLVWRYDELCRDDNALARGKLPDVRGRVPGRGAY
ncbi:MAG: hypothetical protein H0W30_14870 [Gemmatimonadaceae bacterium]|nr:hypothetical protein [Gemmatimonadaceae bacterium]MDQ3518218.1 hypothetical protein [Gemmatimonadota bacterium]